MAALAGEFIQVHCGRVYGCIYGDLPNKSNRRRFVLLGKKGQKKPSFIKSAEALAFEDKLNAIVSLSLQLEGAPIVGATSKGDIEAGAPFLYLSAKVYGKDMRRDLDVELLPDLLQKTGLINNDRAIRRKNYEWFLSDTPRVKFEVGTYR